MMKSRPGFSHPGIGEVTKKPHGEGAVTWVAQHLVHESGGIAHREQFPSRWGAEVASEGDRDVGAVGVADLEHRSGLRVTQSGGMVGHQLVDPFYCRVNPQCVVAERFADRFRDGQGGIVAQGERRASRRRDSLDLKTFENLVARSEIIDDATRPPAPRNAASLSPLRG